LLKEPPRAGSAVPEAERIQREIEAGFTGVALATTPESAPAARDAALVASNVCQLELGLEIVPLGGSGQLAADLVRQLKSRGAPPGAPALAAPGGRGEAGGALLLRSAGAVRPRRRGHDCAAPLEAARGAGAEGMRIVGGDLRGRTLYPVPGRSTRPTADRVRQSLFDVLGQRCDGLHVLDLYAGTGALSLEALSRGAAHATLIEQDAKAAQIILRNAREL